jgi:protein SSD1
LYRPHAKTLDNASRDKRETHSPKIIWFVPADKRLPLVAVPIKHAPADFLKYHEEYKNRIFIVSDHPFAFPYMDSEKKYYLIIHNIG